MLKQNQQINEHFRAFLHHDVDNSRPGSHILGYAGTPEAHSLIGTPEEVTAGLTALQEAGVACVLLFGQGPRDNLRRFAEKVMPRFVAPLTS